MKRRIRAIFNFVAFNLLFFALYLNFIHKDNTVVIGPEIHTQKSEATAAVNQAEPSSTISMEEVKTDTKHIVAN